MRPTGAGGRGRTGAGQGDHRGESAGHGGRDAPSSPGASGSGPGWTRARSSAGGRRWGKGNAYEDRRAQWDELARSLGGRFDVAEKALYDAIHLSHRSWEITVDTYVQSSGNSAVFYTRVHAPFVAQDDFSFRVSPANFFTRILDRIGFKDIRIGDPRIDARYVIRGNDVGRVRSFFLDGRMRAVLLEQESCRLEVRELPWRKRRVRQRVRQVRVRATGEFLEPVRIRGLIQLCTVTLDRLATSGSASRAAVERPPGS